MSATATVQRSRTRHALERAWGDRRVGIAAAAALAVVFGLLVALVMPRGPGTTVQALTLVGSSLAVGFACGFITRSRWALLLVPAIQVASFELGRLGAEGPTVDGIHLDTTFGVLAFVVSRGFYALVGLLPMLVAIAYGAALARRMSGTERRRTTLRSRSGLLIRRVATGLSALAVLALIALLLRPASVPPVTDAAGREVPGSIASLEKIEIGGVDQWIEIRAWSPDKPVLLSLPGGPGQSDLAVSRPSLGQLATDFVVVSWDGRGIGKSYPSFDPTEITTDQAVDETIELTNYLRTRFDERAIYLFGESGGSVTGVRAVQRRPELHHAWIGSGPMVDLSETDRRIYEDLRAYSARTGNRAIADKLRGYSPPAAYTDATTRRTSGSSA